MQKNWGKTLITLAGVLLGNIILAFAVAAFIVPTGIVMGGCNRYCTYDHTLCADIPVGCIIRCKRHIVPVRSFYTRKKICSYNDCKYIFISALPVSCPEDTGNYNADR